MDSTFNTLLLPATSAESKQKRLSFLHRGYNHHWQVSVIQDLSYQQLALTGYWSWHTHSAITGGGSPPTPALASLVLLGEVALCSQFSWVELLSLICAPPWFFFCFSFKLYRGLSADAVFIFLRFLVIPLLLLPVSYNIKSVLFFWKKTE